MSKLWISRFVSDYRFWIILYLIIRIYGITNPPLEVAHNWRQTTVTMVARNFLETDASIFYPRIDIAGEKSGITGMEFPLLNYLIYLVSLIFGYAHWYGRLINLLVSSAGIYYFGRIINRCFDDKTALYSVLILLSSIWFMYSRKIMPDTFSASLVIAGMWFGLKFLHDKGRWQNLLWFLILSAAGVLSKLPSAILLFVLIVSLFSKNVSTSRKLIFLSSGILIILPASAWYLYWVPHLVKTYGFQHFYMGTGIVNGWSELAAKPVASLANFYENALKYSGFVMFLFGTYLLIRQKNRLMIAVFITTLLPFLIFMILAGDNFPRHSYYIIPFVPVMALIAGYGIAALRVKPLQIVVILIICLEGIANQVHDFRVKPEMKAMLSLEESLNKFSDRNDLILINSGLYPTPIYFAHRRGWVAENTQIGNPVYLRELKLNGLKYIIILKKVFGSDMRLNYPVVFTNDDYTIYTLRE